jgi:hypothetical protein
VGFRVAGPHVGVAGQRLAAIGAPDVVGGGAGCDTEKIIQVEVAEAIAERICFHTTYGT